MAEKQPSIVRKEFDAPRPKIYIEVSQLEDWKEWADEPQYCVESSDSLDWGALSKTELLGIRDALVEFCDQLK